MQLSGLPQVAGPPVTTDRAARLEACLADDDGPPLATLGAGGGNAPSNVFRRYGEPAVLEYANHEHEHPEPHRSSGNQPEPAPAERHEDGSGAGGQDGPEDHATPVKGEPLFLLTVHASGLRL